MRRRPAGEGLAQFVPPPSQPDGREDRFAGDEGDARELEIESSERGQVRPPRFGREKQAEKPFAVAAPDDLEQAKIAHLIRVTGASER